MRDVSREQDQRIRTPQGNGAQRDTTIGARLHRHNRTNLPEVIGKLSLHPLMLRSAHEVPHGLLQRTQERNGETVEGLP